MRMSSRPRLGAALCLAAGLLLPIAAHAADRPSPRGWLETQIKRAHALSARKVKPDTSAETKWQADAKALIDDILDWDEMTRRSLGSQWRKIDASQQTQFSGLLRRLIETSYRSRLRTLVREDVDKPNDVEIDWLDERVRTEGAKLEAKISAGEDSALVGFSLNWDEDRWRVYDIAIDDLSTVRTYRSNFNKIVKREGWDALIDRLQRKIADIEAGRADFAKPGGFDGHD